MNNKLEKNIENKEIFIEEILKYKQLLYRIALTRLANEEDINEAIQETIISAYNNLYQLKDKSKLKSWIVKILINKINYIYNKTNHKIISFEETQKYVSNEEKYDSNLKIDMERALNKLKYKERLIIMFRYYEMYSIKEIADLLKMNENTVKTKIRRSIEKIKKYYER